MNDETRKALDEIFTSKSGKITPIGASTSYKMPEDSPTTRYVGMFKVQGSTISSLRQLYDDAIAADDAAKLDAQQKADVNAENAELEKANAERVAAAEASLAAARAMIDANRKAGDKGDAQ